MLTRPAKHCQAPIVRMLNVFIAEGRAHRHGRYQPRQTILVMSTWLLLALPLGNLACTVIPWGRMPECAGSRDLALCA